MVIKDGLEDHSLPPKYHPGGRKDGGSGMQRMVNMEMLLVCNGGNE